MLNDDAFIAAAVVRDAMANIFEFAAESAVRVLGANTEKLRAELHETVFALMAHLITVDGQFDPRERAFLRQLLDFGQEPNAELNFLRNYTERWRVMEKNVPEFFRIAVDYDVKYKTETARGIMREIQIVANNCSVTDKHFAASEAEVIRRYLRLLDNYLEGRTGSTAAWLEP